MFFFGFSFLTFLTTSSSFSTALYRVCIWRQKIPGLGQSGLNSLIMAPIVWKRYTLFLIRLGFILARCLLLRLIKLIYAGRVPAITHKPQPRACVRAKVCAQSIVRRLVCVYARIQFCVCIWPRVGLSLTKCACESARVRFWGLKSSGARMPRFSGGYEAVQLYETSAYVGYLDTRTTGTHSRNVQYVRTRA